MSSSPRANLLQKAMRALDRLASGEIDLTYFDRRPDVFATGQAYVCDNIYDNGIIVGHRDYEDMICRAFQQALQSEAAQSEAAQSKAAQTVTYRRTSRNVGPPIRYSSTHDDFGREWARGSGAASAHTRNGVAYTLETDRDDHDMQSDYQYCDGSS